MDKNGMMTSLREHQEKLAARQNAALAEDKVVPLKVVDPQKVAQANSIAFENLANRANRHPRKQ